MKRTLCLLASALCLLAFATDTYAQQTVTFGELRTMIDDGTKRIEEDTYITGIVISDFGNVNMEYNTSRHHTSVETKLSRLRAYVESPDGQYGMRLIFKRTAQLKPLTRYATVTLNLKGAKLVRSNPRRYTLDELTDANIVETVAGTEASLPRKVKRISELTDEDMYTYVTLTDCEFTFDDGSYCNIYETYAQKSELNASASPNGIMDGWATLLHDSEGNQIYMLVNSLCQWRRDGRGVPKGTGTLSGIVVNPYLPRYGGAVMGRYAVRPLDAKDIAFSWSDNSTFKTIAEWNWNDGSATFSTTNGDAKEARGRQIKADMGAGLLSCTADASVVRGRDFNNPSIETNKVSWNKGVKGIRNNGTMLIRTEACNWWDWEGNTPRSVNVEFSTAGITGNNIVLAFSFGAGELKPETSYAFPVYWKVQYSTDGVNFKDVKAPRITMRSIPWWRINNINGKNYPTSAEAGLGLTEHLVNLPEEVWDKERVVLRIVPAAKNVATLAFEQSHKGAMRPNLKTMTSINFGAIAVRYN